MISILIRRPVAWITLFAGAAMIFAGCSSTSEVSGEPPTIAVSTGLLADVVERVVGDQAAVVTIMAAGIDPHEFQPSARDVVSISEAAAFIVNGASFEAGLADVADSARSDGVDVYEMISAVATLGGPEIDPHFFTDPRRMAGAVDGLVEFLGAVDGIDAGALRRAGEQYVSELRTLDSSIEAVLEVVPEANRRLVTGHEVFNYFADRYGFEIVGVILPGRSTSASVSASALAGLAEIMRAEGVAAIFTDASSPNDLAQTLASEVGDVAVVELFSESLGTPGSGADSYIEMWRTNAARIAAALSGAR